MFHLEVRLRKRVLRAIFIVKMIILPRQARDKHRERTQNETCFLIGFREGGDCLPHAPRRTLAPGESRPNGRGGAVCDPTPHSVRLCCVLTCELKHVQHEKPPANLDGVFIERKLAFLSTTIAQAR